MKNKLTFNYSKKKKDFEGKINTPAPNTIANINFILHLFTNQIDVYPYSPGEVDDRSLKLLEEFEKRGYDPKTIKFSIERLDGQ